jgi:Na+/proline symporter
MSAGTGEAASPILADIALIVALALAAFSILFGTRHVDATEHQHGLILAIAAESLIKLIAFLVIGIFVTFFMFDGFGDLFRQASQAGDIIPVFSGGLDGGLWLTMILLSFCCALLLPRQFHVTIVENNTEAEYRRAAWVFPLYLVAINVFVVPIAVAGMILFPAGSVNADMFVMELPISVGADWILAAAFIGGLSAATAMVIVASVSLSVMICNDLVTPILVRRSGQMQEFEQLGPKLLMIRRMAIIAIMLMAYAYDRYAGSVAALASIGLLSFAAIAQLAPSFFGGLVWRRGTARGAIAGMAVGILVWAYTLLLPDLVDAGLVSKWIMTNGAFGVGLLQPERLFGLTFNPLTHGVFWSLTLNMAAYVIVSLLRAPEPVERLQASEFVPPDLTPLPQGIRLSKTRVDVTDLERTVARYLGPDRARRHFEAYALERGVKLAANSEADVHLIRYAERVLASAIGAPSSRIALSLLLERRNASSRGALKLLDEASAALQYNRDLLQTAIDHVRDGIGVFDRDLRLICWNRRFRGALDLAPLYGQIGTSLGEILREALAKNEAGDRSPRDLEELADETLRILLRGRTFRSPALDRIRCWS